MSSLEDLLALLRQRFGLKARSTDLQRMVVRATEVAMRQRRTVESLLTQARIDPKTQLELATSLTVEESYFFRQAQHFDYVAYLMKERLNRSTFARFRVWSAGCSGGDEAHSVAIMAHEHLTAADRVRVEILATDIDSLSLTRAQSGTVSRWSLRSIEPWLLSKYFHPRGNEHQLDLSVRSLVKFFHMPLLEHAQTIESGSLDVVFFRNVAIYLEPEMLSALWQQFARVLGPNGTLLIAATDPRPDEYFESVLEDAPCSAFRATAAPHSAVTASGSYTLYLPSAACVAPTAMPMTRTSSQVETLLSHPFVTVTDPLLEDAGVLRSPTTLNTTGTIQPTTLPAIQPIAPSASKLHPSPTVLVEAARQAADQGHTQQALRLLNEMLAEDPGHLPARLLRGQLYLSLSELTLAEPDFAEIVTCAPQHLEARYWFALCLGDAGKREEARAQLSAMCRRDGEVSNNSDLELLRAAQDLHERLAG